MSDFGVRCYDCGFIGYPLTQEAAIERAVEHTDTQEHSDCHALPESALLPIIGYMSDN